MRLHPPGFDATATTTVRGFRLLLLVFCGLTAGLLGQITEFTSTVAPGRFLLEMDAVSLKLNHAGGGKYTALGLASTFLTTGVTDNWDVQVGAALFINQKFESGGFTDRRSGVGDLSVRTKWRFFENETTGMSLALMPYIKLPTNSGGVGNDALEGGVIVPWSMKLPGGGAVHAMGTWDVVRNDANNGYDSFWYASAAFSQPLTGLLNLYAEASVAKSSSGAPWAGTIGGGATVRVSQLFWWDFAIYRGISDGAADWNPVVRINWAF